MARVKEDKKVLTREDKARMAELEAESDHILDLLFDDPGNEALIDRLHQNGVEYVRLSGEKTLEY